MNRVTSSPRVRASALCTAAAALTISTAAIAASDANPQARSNDANDVSAKPAETSGAATGEGMRAYVDPTTGALRAPTSEDVQAESTSRQAAAKAPPVLQVTRMKNGVLMVRDVDNSFAESMVVSKSADGKLNYECVHGTPTTVADAAPTKWEEQ